MRRLIVGGVIPVIVVAMVASLAGILSYGHDQYRPYVTPRGETVQVQEAGVYRLSIKPLVFSGIPWDFARLFFVVPLLGVSLLLYLRGLLRGAMLLVGVLASLLYQYLLWTFDRAYNSLYLVYVALFSLSLCSAVLLLTRSTPQLSPTPSAGDSPCGQQLPSRSSSAACCWSSVSARSCLASGPARCRRPGVGTTRWSTKVSTWVSWFRSASELASCS